MPMVRIFGGIVRVKTMTQPLMKLPNESTNELLEEASKKLPMEPARKLHSE